MRVKGVCIRCHKETFGVEWAEESGWHWKDESHKAWLEMAVYCPAARTALEGRDDPPCGCPYLLEHVVEGLR